jgi:hypothetical protein
LAVESKIPGISKRQILILIPFLLSLRFTGILYCSNGKKDALRKRSLRLPNGQMLGPDPFPHGI